MAPCRMQIPLSKRMQGSFDGPSVHAFITPLSEWSGWLLVRRGWYCFLPCYSRFRVHPIGLCVNWAEITFVVMDRRERWGLG